jgi:hypothetical protein
LLLREERERKWESEVVVEEKQSLIEKDGD